MRQIPPCEPTQLVAGDTVQWTKSLSDYLSSDGWTLSYRVVGAEQEITAADIDADANTSGGWDVTIPAAASVLAQGTYRLIGFVAKASTSERYVIHDEAIRVDPDVAAGALDSILTDNQRTLAAIEARLAGRVASDQESVAIDGTALTRIPIAELASLRGVYAARVWRELHPGRSNPVHAMRFTRAR